VAGDFSGIHKTTTGKIVKKVSSVIAGLSSIMIRMPQTEEQSPGGDQTESSF
jgi:hypothetical protein